MTRRNLLMIGMSAGLVLATHLAATARPVLRWSRAELWKKADLVVLATVESSRDESVPEKAKADTWVPVLTRFHVQALLKGSPDRSRPDETMSVTVRHHRYFGLDQRVRLIDGPSFVSFDPKQKHEYLVFLAAKGEGVYEPVTGQYDPWQSFLRVEPYSEEAERTGR